MCLDYLKKFPVKLDENGVGVGYKVFTPVGIELYPEVFSRVERRPYKRGRWYKSRIKKAIIIDRGEYVPGFHIFRSKLMARNWQSWGDRIQKIRFRGVLHTGVQRHNYLDMNIIVAREMMIPEGK